MEAFGFPSELDGHPLVCEGQPELETRARGDSGTVTAVTLRLPLQMLLRDSTGTHWRLRGVGAFAPDATSFQIESTDRAG